MKSSLFIRTLLIIVGILFALNVVLLLKPNSPTSYAAKSIEYKVIDASELKYVPQVEIFLNELGKEGWELIQVNFLTGGMIFKR